MFNNMLKAVRQGYKLIGHDIIINKRPHSKYWQAMIYISDAKRYKVISTQTEDMNEAIIFAIKKQGEIETSVKNGAAPFAKTFDMVALEWYQSREKQVKRGDKSTGTLNIYRNITHNHLIPFFKGRPINQLGKSDTERYIDAILAKETVKSKAVFGHHKTTFGLIMRYAQENGHYKRLVIPDMSIPKYNVNVGDTESRAPFTDEEIDMISANYDRFIESLKNDAELYEAKCMKAWAEFMIHTGCRPHDFSHFRWSDIAVVSNDKIVFKFSDIPKGMLLTALTTLSLSVIQLTSHSSNKLAHLQVRLRGKNAKRTASVDQQYIPTLLWWIKESVHKDIDGLVFASRGGKGPVSGSRIFKKYLLFCGIYPDIRDPDDPDKMAVRVPYSLRHTFITRKLVEGKTPFDISEQVGNTVEEIQRTYSHMLPGHLYKKIFSDNQ